MVPLSSLYFTVHMTTIVAWSPWVACILLYLWPPLLHGPPELPVYYCKYDHHCCMVPLSCLYITVNMTTIVAWSPWVACILLYIWPPLLHGPPEFPVFYRTYDHRCCMVPLSCLYFIVLMTTIVAWSPWVPCILLYIWPPLLHGPPELPVFYCTYDHHCCMVPLSCLYFTVHMTTVVAWSPWVACILLYIWPPLLHGPPELPVYYCTYDHHCCMVPLSCLYITVHMTTIVAWSPWVPCILLYIWPPLLHGPPELPVFYCTYDHHYCMVPLSFLYFTVLMTTVVAWSPWVPCILPYIWPPLLHGPPEFPVFYRTYDHRCCMVPLSSLYFTVHMTTIVYLGQGRQLAGSQVSLPPPSAVVVVLGVEFLHVLHKHRLPLDALQQEHDKLVLRRQVDIQRDYLPLWDILCTLRQLVLETVTNGINSNTWYK